MKKKVIIDPPHEFQGKVMKLMMDLLYCFLLGALTPHNDNS